MSSTEATTTKRRRGRPRNDDSEDAALVTRDVIIDHAYERSRTVPFDELSFVQMARELGVVAGSIHYHIGTKDDLNTAVLNRFFKDLVAELKASMPAGDWRETLQFLARTLLRHWRRHMGVAQHIQTRARYRLFQRVAPGETDYGAAFLDLAFDTFRKAGFSAAQTALFYHALAMHCLASANSDVARLEPAAHEKFLRGKVGEFDPERYPGLAFALAAFAEIKMDETFEVGLEALLDRFAAARGSEQSR